MAWWRRNPRVGNVVLIAALTVLAWCERFVQDDAFISFRYADHLAKGQGLVWNVGGERIEGFTNLLWTLTIAGFIRLGCDPVTASFGLGLACFAVTLVVAGEAALALTGSAPWSWAAIALLGSNYSFRAYATGGLETALQTCLLTAGAWLVLRGRRDGGCDGMRLAAISMILAAAVATRLDSGLIVAVLGLTALWTVARRPSAQRPERRVPALLALILPFTALVGALVAFKLMYFHHLLPNTYYAKEPGFGLVFHGVEYLLAFARDYGLFAPVAIAAVYVPRAVRADGRLPLVLAGCAIFWALYVASVGGDFMEYRFAVPALPFIVLFLLWAFARSAADPRLVGALVAVAVVESAAHEYETYDEPFIYGGAGIETIHGLASHLTSPQQDWTEIGKALGRELGGAENVTIAVGAAGVIPYYAGLRTIDIFGLSDSWIARHGAAASGRPGHTRSAPLAYLVYQRVNLVVVPRGEDGPAWEPASYSVDDLHAFVTFTSPSDVPPGTRVVELPIAGERRLRVLYLQASPIIERRIQERGWRVFRVGPS